MSADKMKLRDEDLLAIYRRTMEPEKCSVPSVPTEQQLVDHVLGKGVVDTEKWLDVQIEKDPESVQLVNELHAEIAWFDAQAGKFARKVQGSYPKRTGLDTDEADSPEIRIRELDLRKGGISLSGQMRRWLLRFFEKVLQLSEADLSMDARYAPGYRGGQGMVLEAPVLDENGNALIDLSGEPMLLRFHVLQAEVIPGGRFILDLSAVSTVGIRQMGGVFEIRCRLEQGNMAISLPRMKLLEDGRASISVSMPGVSPLTLPRSAICLKIIHFHSP